MAKFKIVVTEIREPKCSSTQTPVPITNAENECVGAQIGYSVAPECEVFRQVIDDLDLRKFVRTINATPRRSRKTKADAGKA